MWLAGHAKTGCLHVFVTDQRLDQQGVKNHSKLMVLKVSDGEEEKKKNQEEERRKKNQEESIQRTHKAFNILSSRGQSVCRFCSVLLVIKANGASL